MSELRQSLFAYLLLATLLVVPVMAFLVPSIERLTDGRQSLEQAEQKLIGARSQAKEDSARLDSYPKELASLMRKGHLLYAASSSDATNRFQKVLKPILLKHQASLRQVRPSVEIIEQGLSKSSLELSLNMPLESFGGLLEELSQMQPRVQVDSASVRSLKSVSNSQDLELNLTLSIWFLDRSSYPATLAAQIDQHYQSNSSAKEFHDSEPDDTRSLTKVSSAVDYVSALFDRSVRLRLRSPNVDYYSVAAITVSPKGKLALIKIKGQPGTVRLTAGDMLDVWRVDAIDESGIELSFNQQRERLEWSR